MSTSHGQLSSRGGRDAAGVRPRRAAVAERLFPDRELVAATVDIEPDREPGAEASTDRKHPVRTLRIATGGAGSARMAAALAEYARDHRAAAIVLGSRGRSAVRGILLGSAAAATLHHAQLPVLIVSAHDRERSGLPA